MVIVSLYGDLASKPTPPLLILRVKMAQITLDINDQLMVMAAHRYSLGRSSYMVSSCVEWLKKHWDQFSPNTKSLIIRDTKYALDNNEAGMSIDVNEWDNFLEWVNENA